MSMTMSRCYSIIYWMVCQSLKAGNKSNYLCFKPVPQNQTRDENSLVRFLRKGSYKKLIRYEGIRSWKRKTLSKDGIWSVVLERVGFRGGSVVKNPPTNAGDAGWIPELGRSPGGGNDNPLQYCCLGQPNGQRSLVFYRHWSCKNVRISDLKKTILQGTVDVSYVSGFVMMKAEKLASILLHSTVAG